MLTHDQSARRRGPSLADRTDMASEQSLAAYWTAYVDAGRGGASFILRNLPQSWAALRAVRRLPVVEARPFRLVYSAVFTQAAINGLIGIIAFILVERGPEMLQRRRARGASLGRRHY